MAHYSALWTSANDPEFVQMRKVKQLTERHLAMSISNMDLNYRRRVKKAQEQIRENQDILEVLEKEKETRACQILATYLKHQRMKEAANKLLGKFRLRKEKRERENIENGVKPRKVDDGIEQLTSIPGIKHRVLRVHTFPFLYHSYGDKPCPRYSMFLKSQEYGPPEVTSKNGKSRPSILVSKKDSVLPPLPPIPTSKMRKVVTAVKVLNTMSKK